MDFETTPIASVVGGPRTTKAKANNKNLAAKGRVNSKNTGEMFNTYNSQTKKDQDRPSDPSNYGSNPMVSGNSSKRLSTGGVFPQSAKNSTLNGPQRIKSSAKKSLN